MGSIYLLYLEDEGLPFYVGYTSRMINDRLYQHNRWVRSEFGKEAKALELEHLCDEDENKAWRYAERKWISYFRDSFGHSSILNRHKGGQGFEFTQELIDKIKLRLIGRKRSLKERIAISFGSKGRPCTNKESLRKPRSEITKKRISASLIGKHKESKSDEHKSRIGDSNRRIHEEKRSIMEELNCSFKEAGRIRKDRKG